MNKKKTISLTNSQLIHLTAISFTVFFLISSLAAAVYTGAELLPLPESVQSAESHMPANDEYKNPIPWSDASTHHCTAPETGPPADRPACLSALSEKSVSFGSFLSVDHIIPASPDDIFSQNPVTEHIPVSILICQMIRYLLWKYRNCVGKSFGSRV